MLDFGIDARTGVLLGNSIMPKPAASDSEPNAKASSQTVADGVGDGSEINSGSTQHSSATRKLRRLNKTASDSSSSRSASKKVAPKKSSRIKVKKADDFIGVSLAADRYRVKSQLGKGSMAYVFLAADCRLETDVVVKVPKPEKFTTHDFRERFTKECQLLVRFSHPHVVGVLDVGEYDELPYVVMQLLSGGSLADRLQDESNEKGQMTPESLRSWVPGVGRALDFCARKGMIHRDVKPANILFDADKNPYVSDFGLSKVMYGDHTDLNSSETAAGAVLGTPNYIAPEIVLGKDYDGRADQYSLGISIYHTMLGRAPMQGGNATATMINQTTKQLQLLSDIRSDVPRELALAIRKSIDKKPENRFATCEEFAETAIEALRAPLGKTVSSTPASTIKKKKRPGTTSSSQSSVRKTGPRKKSKSSKSGIVRNGSAKSDLDWLDLASDGPAEASLPPKKGKARSSRAKKKSQPSGGLPKAALYGLGGAAVIVGLFIFALMSILDSDSPVAATNTSGKTDSDAKTASGPKTAGSVTPSNVDAGIDARVNLWDWNGFKKSSTGGNAAEGIAMAFSKLPADGPENTEALQISFTAKNPASNWAQPVLKGANFARHADLAYLAADLNASRLGKLVVEFDYKSPDKLAFGVSLESGPRGKVWENGSLKLTKTNLHASPKFQHFKMHLKDIASEKKRPFCAAMKCDPNRGDFYLRMRVNGRGNSKFPTSSLIIRNVVISMSD